MIEIYLLEQLVAVEEYGTLLAAAKALSITQPALSRSMKKLEDQIGVTLFDRSKNRITMNDTGHLAARFARETLEQQESIIKQIKAFDKSRHTISVGACAPLPIERMVPLLTRLYPNMTISSELKMEEELLTGLKNNEYQLVLLPSKPDDESLYSCEYIKEQLFLSVPNDHPLASYDEVGAKDLEGQNVLIYQEIGFWFDWCKQSFKNTHFLIMEEVDAINDIIGAGAFPSFASDETIRRHGVGKNQKIIRLNVPGADVTYYWVCQKKGREKFAKLFKQIV